MLSEEHGTKIRGNFSDTGTPASSTSPGSRACSFSMTKPAILKGLIPPP